MYILEFMSENKGFREKTEKAAKALLKEVDLMLQLQSLPEEAKERLRSHESLEIIKKILNGRNLNE